MKKKFIAMLTITTMTLSLLVGCGQPATPNTNEDTSTEQNTEVNTEVKESGDDVVTKMPTEEPSTEPEVQEPTIEPTPEEVVDVESDKPMYDYSHDWTFPEGMNGFTKKYLNEDYPEWSVNFTHYVDINGNEMNFTWEGPATLGESAWFNSNTLNLMEKSNTYEIRAWHSGPMNMEDIEPCLTADSTAWTNSTSAYCSLPENGYYNVEQVGNAVIITYELIDNNSGKKGYARFLADADIGEAYCFMYLEAPEVFDNTRVMNVIESFDFWTDYTPEE